MKQRNIQTYQVVEPVKPKTAVVTPLGTQQRYKPRLTPLTSASHAYIKEEARVKVPTDIRSIPTIKYTPELDDPQLNRSESTHVVKPSIIKKMTAKEAKEKARQKMVEDGNNMVTPIMSNPGAPLTEYQRQRTRLHKWANPLQYSGLVDEDNMLTSVLEVINPYSWADHGFKSHDSFKEGDVVGGVVNLMGAIPFVPPAALASTAWKVIANRSRKAIIAKAYRNKLAKETVKDIALDEAVDAVPGFLTKKLRNQKAYYDNLKFVRDVKAPLNSVKGVVKSSTPRHLTPEFVAKNPYYDLLKRRRGMLTPKAVKTPPQTLPEWNKWYKDVTDYKPSSKYKSLPKGSEIPETSLDWGKWNKEILNDKPLLREYGEIEAVAKADGTWMKNADGSAFKGSSPTIEDLSSHGVTMSPSEAIKAQFVEQRSRNFAKAFPNPVRDAKGNIQTNFHGSKNKFDSFTHQTGLHTDPTAPRGELLGRGVYSSPERSYAGVYMQKSKYNPESTLYSLYHNSNTKQVDGLQLQEYMHKKLSFMNKTAKEVRLPEVQRRQLQEQIFQDHRKLEAALGKHRGNGSIQPGRDFLATGEIQVAPYSNIPKSMLGNNGKFSMSNPNIYKAIVGVTLATGSGKAMTQK